MFAKVVVMGLGYVGLPTAALLASRGMQVVGIDTNLEVVDSVNNAQNHVSEPHLDTIIKSVIQTKCLRAEIKAEPADVFIIAVPTPFNQAHEPDLQFVEAAADSIATVLEKGNLIILESTSPVGTTEKIAQRLSRLRADLIMPTQSDTPDVAIAYCPERVLPGRVLLELVENDRVIGGITPHCSKRASDLYKTFVRGKCISTNAKTAEMVKLA